MVKLVFECRHLSSKVYVHIYIYIFFFSTIFGTLQHMEFLGQGSDPNQGLNLSHSCGNASSLTHCARLGTKPASQPPRCLQSLVPQGKLPPLFFLAAPWHVELPGQGSDPGHSHKPSWSWSNAGSLTHYAHQSGG